MLINKILRIWTEDKVHITIWLIVASLIGSSLLLSQKTPVYFQDKISKHPIIMGEGLLICGIILFGLLASYIRTFYNNKNSTCIQPVYENFADTRGIKIKILPDGEYEKDVAYCFHCKSPLSSTHRTHQLKCSKCGYQTSIQARHLCVVLAELKGEETPDWWKKY